MQLYRVNPTVEYRGGEWAATRAEGHAALKNYPLNTHPDARLELVEVPTGKDNVLAILRGGGKFTVEKTWMLTSRGGLTEVANGE